MKHKLHASANGYTPIENTNDRMDFPRVAFTYEHASCTSISSFQKLSTTSLIISSGHKGRNAVKRERTKSGERRDNSSIISSSEAKDRAHFSIVIRSRYIHAIAIIVCTWLHFAFILSLSLSRACFILPLNRRGETQYLSFYRVYYCEKPRSRTQIRQSIDRLFVPYRSRRLGASKMSPEGM